jgi:integrase/recombinase XerC
VAPRKTEVVEAELVEEETALAVLDVGEIALPQAEVDDLYAAFLADKSALTAKNYRIDLEAFAAFLSNPPPGGRHFTAAQAIQWLCSRPGAEANRVAFHYKTYLKGGTGKRKYSASTINRRLAALRSITKLARMFGMVTWKLEVEGEKARTFKDTAGCGVEGLHTLVTTLEREIVENEATDKPHESARRWRDRALLHLMYYAGLRRMEPLTAFYPEDLRRSPQDRSPELRIIGKKRDGEQEWVPIGETAFTALEDWIERRGTEPGPMFPGRDKSKPLHENSVGNLVTRLAQAAGVDVTPHGLRHTAITEVLERTGGDVRTAQRFARHSNPATTMVYDDNRQKIAAKGVAALEEKD